MNREKALQKLRDAAGIETGIPRWVSPSVLREIEAALSSPCACEGREPIERGKRRASTVDACSFSIVKGGHYKNLVEIMVFALPTEEGTP